MPGTFVQFRTPTYSYATLFDACTQVWDCANIVSVGTEGGRGGPATCVWHSLPSDAARPILAGVVANHPLRHYVHADGAIHGMDHDVIVHLHSDDGVRVRNAERWVP